MALALGTSALLLGGWAAWALMAPLAVWEVSKSARLQVDREAHPVTSPLDGQVASTRLVLGTEVAAGDVLLELDAREPQDALLELQARLSAAASRVAPLAAEIASEEQALREEPGRLLAETEEARARLREAEAAAGLAGTQSARAERLGAAGATSEADLEKARAELTRFEAGAEALRTGVRRLEAEARARELGKRARIERLRAERSTLTGEIATLEASIAARRGELDRRKLRAPISGRLGEVTPVTAGAFVHAGDRLALVVPEGRLGIVAFFAPGSALGRIRPGQQARLRLEGFAWTEYGTLPATVSAVGSDALSGKVRVELVPHAGASFSVGLEHGLPGLLEIAVEEATPAQLILRAAGRLLDRRERRPPGVAAGAEAPR